MCVDDARFKSEGNDNVKTASFDRGKGECAPAIEKKETSEDIRIEGTKMIITSTCGKTGETGTMITHMNDAEGREVGGTKKIFKEDSKLKLLKEICGAAESTNPEAIMMGLRKAYESGDNLPAVIKSLSQSQLRDVTLPDALTKLFLKKAGFDTESSTYPLIVSALQARMQNNPERVRAWLLAIADENEKDIEKLARTSGSVPEVNIKSLAFNAARISKDTIIAALPKSAQNTLSSGNNTAYFCGFGGANDCSTSTSVKGFYEQVAAIQPNVPSDVVTYQARQNGPSGVSLPTTGRIMDIANDVIYRANSNTSNALNPANFTHYNYAGYDGSTDSGSYYGGSYGSGTATPTNMLGQLIQTVVSWIQTIWNGAKNSSQTPGLMPKLPKPPQGPTLHATSTGSTSPSL